VCLAEFDEHKAPSSSVVSQPRELRFDDVIAELETASRLAALTVRGRELAPELADACRRVSALLTSLRDQFRRDLGLTMTRPDPGR
jgi:hypothetical protein